MGGMVIIGLGRRFWGVGFVRARVEMKEDSGGQVS